MRFRRGVRVVDVHTGAHTTHPSDVDHRRSPIGAVREKRTIGETRFVHINVGGANSSYSVRSRYYHSVMIVAPHSEIHRVLRHRGIKQLSWISESFVVRNHDVVQGASVVRYSVRRGHPHVARSSNVQCQRHGVVQYDKVAARHGEGNMPHAVRRPSQDVVFNEEPAGRKRHRTQRREPYGVVMLIVTCIAHHLIGRQKQRAIFAD